MDLKEDAQSHSGLTFKGSREQRGCHYEFKDMCPELQAGCGKFSPLLTSVGSLDRKESEDVTQLRTCFALLHFFKLSLLCFFHLFLDLLFSFHQILESVRGTSHLPLLLQLQIFQIAPSILSLIFLCSSHTSYLGPLESSQPTAAFPNSILLGQMLASHSPHSLCKEPFSYSPRSQDCGNQGHMCQTKENPSTGTSEQVSSDLEGS